MYVYYLYNAFVNGCIFYWLCVCKYIYTYIWTYISTVHHTHIFPLPLKDTYNRIHTSTHNHTRTNTHKKIPGITESEHITAKRQSPAARLRTSQQSSAPSAWRSTRRERFPRCLHTSRVISNVSGFERSTPRNYAIGCDVSDTVQPADTHKQSRCAHVFLRGWRAYYMTLQFTRPAANTPRDLDAQ